MRGANYSGNCSGFDQLLIRSFQINVGSGFCGACEIERRPRGASQRKAAPTPVSGQSSLYQRTRPTCLSNTTSRWTPRGARLCLRNNWPETDVGAALRCEAPRGRRSISQTPHNSSHAPHWCAATKIRILRVHFSSATQRQMPANAPFYPALAIFGHWHAICSLVRQVSLADYPRPATPFFQGSGPPRSRPSGGQHVEVGSTHQRS